MSYLRSMLTQGAGGRAPGLTSVVAQQASAALGQTYQQVSAEKQRLVVEVDRHETNHLVGGMLDVMEDDVLSPDPETGGIVKLEVSDRVPEEDRKRVAKMLIDFTDRAQLDQVMLQAVWPIIKYGEWIASMVVTLDNGERAIRMVDAFDQGVTLAVYDTFMDVPKYVLTQYSRGSIVRVPPAQAIHFVGKSKLYRTGVPHRVGSTCFEFMKVGRSILRSALDKIKDLKVLDAIPIAKHLANIGVSTLIHVTVGDADSPEDAAEACRVYEKHLNRRSNMQIKELVEVTAADIINSTKFKCLPQWGTGKGGLEVSNVPRIPESAGDFSDLEDTRRSIAAAVGFPYSFLYGGDGQKHETLRVYARYVRKLTSIRRALEFGIRQMIYVYIGSLGDTSFEKFNAFRDVHINFVNKLVNVDELDKLEFTDTTISVLGNISRLIIELDEMGYPDRLDPKLAAYIQRTLSVSGIETTLDKPLIKAEEDTEDADD